MVSPHNYVVYRQYIINNKIYLSPYLHHLFSYHWLRNYLDSSCLVAGSHSELPDSPWGRLPTDPWYGIIGRSWYQLKLLYPKHRMNHISLNPSMNNSLIIVMRNYSFQVVYWEDAIVAYTIFWACSIRPEGCLLEIIKTLILLDILVDLNKDMNIIKHFIRSD